MRHFEAQQKAAGKPPSFFWLDIFVVDENAARKRPQNPLPVLFVLIFVGLSDTYPSEWWQTSFTEAVGLIGHTALVLTPWHAPVPLRRAWCLWEIYSTLGKQAQLSVCLSDAETKDFHSALVRAPRSFPLCSLE